MFHLEVVDSQMVFSYIYCIGFMYFSCVFGSTNIYYS